MFIKFVLHRSALVTFGSQNSSIQGVGVVYQVFVIPFGSLSIPKQLIGLLEHNLESKIFLHGLNLVLKLGSILT